MAKANKVPARVIVDTTVDGVAYKPNQAVTFSAGKAKALEKAGQIDTDSDAVKYVISQGAELIEHLDPEELEAAAKAASTAEGGAGATNQAE
ncbi:hypothetical protein [Noviherbaspirillum autotrophicum]|uniref:Uncharacterized protein n=1 Tax=Noviherbaspirillum autotrophicum TaxID=709839 RepID=A0A0C1YJZ7_9BURK|nr:hypothetical protein [Noviherbaspirillum autotrophicum]KIF80780.1 hypothetical protein TSA66_08025 [Noviherbaspirillum autotrophicum]KIF80817.1 hypothetical protein TSA66_08270 [Noviherbaspirillum autotrophicum]KIF84042.1 hypothetical protein TSA66_00960 [Noviherbaspirillum autotrophicum]